MIRGCCGGSSSTEGAGRRLARCGRGGTLRNEPNQLEEMGENIREYESIWGYSLGETEPRIPIYEYPEYEFSVTEEITNLEI